MATRTKRKAKPKWTPHQKFLALQGELNDQLYEREDEVRGMLAALLARTNVLLLGPAGTAKTLLTTLLCQALGLSYFYWLLTKFSVPEEIFGPCSMKGIKEDRHRRITAGKLPEAAVAFLDEVN